LAELESGADVVGSLQLHPDEEIGSEVPDILHLARSDYPGVTLEVVVLALRGVDEGEQS
jgi:hypothetical protein